MNKIRMMWNGDIPLWKSFWIWGVLGSALLQAPLTYLSIVIFSENQTQFAAIYYLFIFFMIAYYSLIIGGTWRSAGNYNGKVFIKYIARLFVIMWALNLYKFVMGVFLPNIKI
jgi:hypothetical protein